MTRTNIETHIEAADEARVAPAHWKRVLLAVLGIVTFWAWLLTQPPYHLTDSAAAGWWLAALGAGGLWAWFALWNTHRRLLALTGLAMPAAMVVIAWQTLELRSALDATGLPHQAGLAPASWLWAWAGLLAAAPLLVILAFSWRAGVRQAARARARRKARAAAAAAAVVAEAARLEAAEAAEAAASAAAREREQRRWIREELIEEATARLATKVAGGSVALAGDTDELAALALFQDRERRGWRQVAGEQQARAEAAEARLATKDEEIRQLRSRLRQEFVVALASPVTDTIAGAVDAVGAAGLAGGAFAGDRVRNAWNKSSGG